MNFYILTLFPEMVMNGLNTSIIGRASKAGYLNIEAIDIRDYARNKHHKVDDYPYGGGAGMLMQAQPVYDAWDSVTKRTGKKVRTVYLTPQGRRFDQPLAKELAKEEDLILLCGHYEGIDERVLEEVVTDYVSIGDYVLTGGELGAMVMVDAISRMVPGVLKNEFSGVTESLEGNLLEYPQYSRPEVWQGKQVPEVLLSGNQKNIDAWRLEQSIERTKERRPDLYQKYEEMQECRELLRQQKLLHMDMTELIDRGQAELLYVQGKNVCLRDTVSGIVFLSVDDAKSGKEMVETVIVREKPELLVIHQEYMVSVIEQMLQGEVFVACQQFVYTKREKLPITGLYRLDGKSEEHQIEIRKLGMQHMEIANKHYGMMDDPGYIQGRIEAGKMFGAFYGETLAGFIGLHEEGSLGMLEVLPEYRGRHIGKALETYLINDCLEHGFTPFTQVVERNEISMKLQESLGLCKAKQKVYFMEKMLYNTSDL